MTSFTYDMLNKKLANGEVSTCISTNGARIIIPTSCNDVVGFTNPDDLDVDLLKRWKNGERGPEFENQKLQPGDALVMYNNGINIDKILNANSDWQTDPKTIKKVIEQLYSCAESGAKNTEPAIWNTNYHWAEEVELTTTAGQKVTKEIWTEKSGKVIEAVKAPKEQPFLHMMPGDTLTHPDGTKQSAGAMGSIAVQQPDGNWNIVQLGAKGYVIVKENISRSKNHSNTGIRDVFSRIAALRGMKGKGTSY